MMFPAPSRPHPLRPSSFWRHVRGPLLGAVGILGLMAGAKIAEAGEPAVTLATAPREDPEAAWRRGQWSTGLDFSFVYHTVPNPILRVFGHRTGNPLNYRLITQTLSVRRQLTSLAGPGLLRGCFEGSFGITGSAIVHGPETYFIGAGFGLRYYFVQPGARLAPWVEARGAVGQTDSRGFFEAQQQDLTFTYIFSAGVRYEVNRRWSVTLGAAHQHISNAYLTHPNYGFDVVGFNLGVIRRF